MHRTTTTKVSDTIERLVELDSRLNDVEWMPIEERVQVGLVGSALLQGVIDATSSDEFTDEEYTFIENLIDKVNGVVQDMMLNNNDTDGGC